MSKPTLWVAIYDLHYPKVDWPTFNAILDFLKQNKVEGFVFGGDQLDNECISHHTKGKGLYRLPGQYQKDERGFNEKCLSPIEALTKGATKVWIQGNHEDWESQLVENHPELQGSVERYLRLGLADRGWKIIERGLTYSHGELTFAHGDQLSGSGNQNPAMHAKKAVELFCQNILYGHFHSPMSYTKILPTDVSRKWMSWCSPIAGNTNPTYLQNRPTAWLTGFTVIEFREKGLFNVYPVIVIDGTFSYGGKIYGKKGK
jgi:predicted phosphodiesterase